MFEEFSEVAKGKEEIVLGLQNEIISHLENLCQEFYRYFPALLIDMSLVINLFYVEPDIVPDSVEDEFLEMKCDSGKRDSFSRTFYTGILLARSKYIIKLFYSSS